MVKKIVIAVFCIASLVNHEVFCKKKGPQLELLDNSMDQEVQELYTILRPNHLKKFLKKHETSMKALAKDQKKAWQVIVDAAQKLYDSIVLYLLDNQKIQNCLGKAYVQLLYIRIAGIYEEKITDDRTRGYQLLMIALICKLSTELPSLKKFFEIKDIILDSLSLKNLLAVIVVDDNIFNTFFESDFALDQMFWSNLSYNEYELIFKFVIENEKKDIFDYLTNKCWLHYCRLAFHSLKNQIPEEYRIQHTLKNQIPEEYRIQHKKSCMIL